MQDRAPDPAAGAVAAIPDREKPASASPPPKRMNSRRPRNSTADPPLLRLTATSRSYRGDTPHARTGPIATVAGEPRDRPSDRDKEGRSASRAARRIGPNPSEYGAGVGEP